MSFLFASSHLPEVKRPEEEEDDEDVQPMQRSGMVRAFSHLPEPGQGQSAAPFSQRGAEPLGGQSQRTGPEGLGTTHEEGVAAAKASGLFDIIRHHYNQGSTQHFMDEDGNLHPHTESALLTSSSHPVLADRSSWNAEPESHAGHDPDADAGLGANTSPPAAEDNGAWYIPHIIHEDLHPQGHDENDSHDSDSGLEGPASRMHGLPLDPAPGSIGHLTGKGTSSTYIDPGIQAPPEKWGQPTRDAGFDNVRAADHRDPATGQPRGRADKAEYSDLVYHPQGSPAEQGDQRRGFFQNVSDVQGARLAQSSPPKPPANATPSAPQMIAQGSKPGAQTAASQPAPAQGAAPSPANAASQQPSQTVETPYEDLRDYLKKSKNPLFIKDFYDGRTPLEEKLRLRQLILSLKAPEGEKLPLYIQHLQHWFNAKNRPPVDQDGKEEPVKHPLKDLMQWPVVKEAYDKVLYRFGSLPDGKLGKKTIVDWVRAHPDATKPGGVAVPDTYWDAPADGSHPDPVKKLFGLPKPGNDGYYYAFGNAAITAKSSGVRGIMDKDGGVRFRGTFNTRLHDRYDWNLGQGTPLKPDPKIPMDKIRQYIPKDIPVISPKGDEIQVGDSFFKEMLEKGYGRDFDVEATQEPVTLEFYQAKPGGPVQTREIPRTP